jgi:hypothetical protein
VWIKLVVSDGFDLVLFASGAHGPSGAIDGNANDETPSAFEPHYRQITRADQVQIYEPILADASGAVTTGLLEAVRYAKDNRLLPRGFDKAAAHPDIAVHGDAKEDPDFTGGTDRVRYLVDVGADRVVDVRATLLYQPIGFRWAENLRAYKADEPARFMKYYDALSSSSAAVLSEATIRVRR